MQQKSGQKIKRLMELLPLSGQRDKQKHLTYRYVTERREFDKEFKLMTVDLSKSHANLNELAKEPGIRVELLYRWRNELFR